MQLKFWRRDIPEDIREHVTNMNILSDAMKLPYTMIICDHCGAAGWRYPPHFQEPCPLVVAISESAGLKIDAERQTTIRAGIQMEEAFRLLREMHGMEEEEEE